MSMFRELRKFLKIIENETKQFYKDLPYRKIDYEDLYY